MKDPTAFFRNNEDWKSLSKDLCAEGYPQLAVYLNVRIKDLVDAHDALVKERDALKAEVERLQSVKVPGRLENLLKEQSQEMRILQAKLLLWKECCFRVLPGRVYQSILDKDLKMRETLNSSEGVE